MAKAASSIEFEAHYFDECNEFQDSSQEFTSHEATVKEAKDWLSTANYGCYAIIYKTVARVERTNDVKVTAIK